MSEETGAYLPCEKRQEQQYHNTDGSLRPLHRCNHPSSAMYVKEVTPADCAECPFRIATKLRPPEYRETHLTIRNFGQPKLLEDGSLVYPRQGWEPPSTPAGYKPKSTDPRSDDAWVFLPMLKHCVDRQMVNTVKPCGCINVILMCESPTSEHRGKLVDMHKCDACPVARLKKVHEQQ